MQWLRVLGGLAALAGFAALLLAMFPAKPIGRTPSQPYSWSATQVGFPSDRLAIEDPTIPAAVEAEPEPAPQPQPLAKASRPTSTRMGSARRAPATAAEPRSAPSPSSSEAAMDPEQAVRGALRLAQPAFELCYQAALKANQRVRGRIVVELSVRVSGEVHEAKVVESTVRDDRVMACIARRLKSMRLPPLEEAIDVTVPLSLVPRAG
ncbi:MAG: AgmX/PglI C-terminal domain-containing protein [Deltaproteobacteria bacterium]|nr:AgmX/PglI C-terminal domain-containing protein [Deltaproteobacteria bacterium]